MSRRAAATARRRTAYHHGDLRAALVRAATALLDTEGPLGVTLRGAARGAGVSQAAPYRHFSDKSALLAAVAEDGFRRLRHAIARAARTHARDPVAALRAMAIAVVRFAAAHPSHYRLMSGPANAASARAASGPATPWHCPSRSGAASTASRCSPSTSRSRRTC